jgi:hypothetical protein
MADELLVSFLARKVGVWRAAKVAGYIAAWGIYSQSLSDPDQRRTLDGCGKFWRRSESSMLREQKEFRKAFPDEDNPERIWQLCRQQDVARKLSREKVTADLLVMNRNWAAL